MTIQPSYTAMPNSNHPHMVGLDAWYIMNESGRTVYDYSGRGNHAISTAGLRHDKIGFTRNFSVDGHFIVTSFSPKLIFTVSLWVRRDFFSTGTQTMAAWGHATEASRFFLMGSGIGGATFSSGDGLPGSDFGILKDNPWFAASWDNIVFIREGDSITNGYKAYFNGVQTGQDDSGILNLNGVTDWLLGSHFDLGSFIFNWRSPLTNARFYNRVLDQREITEQIVDPYAPFGINQPFPFPPQGLTPIIFGPLAGGRTRGVELGSIRVGGAE